VSHEHQVEAREQVAPMHEQTFLNQILDAARREPCAPVLILLRQLLAKPRHRAIEVMQIERLDAGDAVVLAPAIRRAIGAADEQSVQHGEEYRSFHREAVLARRARLRVDADRYSFIVSDLPELLLAGLSGALGKTLYVI
jgi:hypothetical protein